ncbi:nitroreductase [Neotabrizicola sp. sgz301269]|uniref:nitroreductase family protein n=1 Tax=Neotabrizicola sp. sgz301269 TaxID=3276282 RepID=UPI0037703D32
MPSPNLAANPAAFAYLETRRSAPAKLFTDPVPDAAELDRILTAALRVPDHGKLEPWRLIVLQGQDFSRLADLAEARARDLGGDAEKIAKGRGQYDLGRLAVVVISSPKASDKIPLTEQVLSSGALCMNLVHAATAAGWGASWLTGWPAHDPVFRAHAFACTEAETVAGIVHIATPPATLPPDRPRPDLARIVQRGLS